MAPVLCYSIAYFVCREKRVGPSKAQNISVGREITLPVLFCAHLTGLRPLPEPSLRIGKDGTADLTLVRNRTIIRVRNRTVR